MTGRILRMHETPHFDDVNLGLRLYELRRESEMRKARSMIGSHVWGKSTEEVLKVFDYDHEENAHLRQVTSYWEMCASFVIRGVFHPAVYLDTCSEAIFTYTCFHPHLAAIRAERPAFLSRTEQLIQDIPAVREKFEQSLQMFAAWQAKMAEQKAKRKPASKKKTAKAKPGKRR